jgi:ribosome modulation factor
MKSSFNNPFDQGYNAFYSDKSEQDNPYQGEDAKQWLLGFKDAQLDEQLITELNK